MADHQSIGVFDSGVGGLTVLRELIRALPTTSFTYLGDTARVPYGTKSPDTVAQYALRCSGRLVAEGVGALVIACNTASAYALDVVRDEYDIPVVGVIEPGARAAADASHSGRIGILGTEGTIASCSYPEALASIRPDAKVYTQACPLFVPLAEEGWVEGDVPRIASEKYLKRMLDAKVDTILLGCTHYPLLYAVIAKTAGPEVTVIDSAVATAQVVAELISAMIPEASDAEVAHRFLVTDAPAAFQTVGERFLGAPLQSVEWIDLR